jgi:anthranilate/para-aminobenzoate synthase component II
MRPKLLLIDNYDSFTYNLVQAFLVLGAEIDVHRNDAITVAEALAQSHTHLVISPGPGTPRDAGVSMRMIEAFAGRGSVRWQGGACTSSHARQGLARRT